MADLINLKTHLKSLNRKLRSLHFQTKFRLNLKLPVLTSQKIITSTANQNGYSREYRRRWDSGGECLRHRSLTCLYLILNPIFYRLQWENNFEVKYNEKKPTRIALKQISIFISFLIFVLLVGCATNQAVNRTKKETVFDRIEDDLARIIIREKQWKYDYEHLQEKLEKRAIKYHELKMNEKLFIESMPDKQLELYSNYLDSLTGGNPAKVELNKRQLIISLDDTQKSYLISIQHEFEKLEQEQKLYIKEHDELLAKKSKIEADYIRNEQWFNGVMSAISAYLGSDKYAYAYRHNSSDALRRMQDTITRNQQRFENLEIKWSLQDIASAIRGF